MEGGGGDLETKGHIYPRKLKTGCIFVFTGRRAYNLEAGGGSLQGEVNFM